MRKNPRSIDAIVEAQVRKWLAEREQRKATDRVPPIITVSRQYGARGAELARNVATRLGYAFWDQELLHAIAEDAHASEAMLASLDEHRRDAVGELMAVFGRDPSLSPSTYMRSLMHVVHSIVAHGSAVIVGRGANYLARSEQALRVRAVAPLHARAAGIAERRGLSRERAEAEILAVDADRRDFVRQSFAREVDEASDYDLIVNTHTLSLESAADILIATYRVRFGIATGN